MKSKEQAAVEDRPADAVDHAAEVLRWIGSGMIGGDRYEQVDRHTEQILGEQHADRESQGGTKPDFLIHVAG